MRDSNARSHVLCQGGLMGESMNSKKALLDKLPKVRYNCPQQCPKGSVDYCVAAAHCFAAPTVLRCLLQVERGGFDVEAKLFQQVMTPRSCPI